MFGSVALRGSGKVAGARMVQQQRTSQQISMPRQQASRQIQLEASMEFIRGVEETDVPEVKLSKSRDGKTGQAQLTFGEPSLFAASSEVGEVTGLYLIDEEGVIQTTDVKAVFSNGKPQRVVATVYLRSPFEWDRFMRFMERYAPDHGLAFRPAKPDTLK